LLCDGGGLYVKKDGKGHVGRYQYHYTFKGKHHEMTLGSCATIGLDEAREAALKQRKLRSEGIDPLSAKRDRQREESDKGMTFEECGKAYVASKREGWRPKYIAWVEASLSRYVYPIIGQRFVQDIGTALVMRVLNQPAERLPQSGRARPFTDGTSLWMAVPTTAGLTRGLMEAIFDWASALGYYRDPNPARWKGNIKNLVPDQKWRKKKQPSMPYKEVAAFLTALRKEADSVKPTWQRKRREFSRKALALKVGMAALEFTILCASRVGEVLGATWSEIDMSAKTWSVPGERMKEGLPHRVPLSSRALEILRAQGGGENPKAFVFPGLVAGRPLCSGTLINLINRIRGDDASHAVNHGFRSTFKTWATERTNFRYPPYVIEMCLAHRLKASEVEWHYQDSDMIELRRPLMEEWAAFVGKAPAGEPVADLGEFRRRVNGK
jgi:integrase